MTLTLLFNQGTPASSIAVAAQQPAHTAAAALAEAFVVSGGAVQLPNLAAAALEERFIVAIAAVQAAHAVLAQVRGGFIVQVAALQSPALASALLVERITVGAAAVQAPALAAATLLERFVAATAAVQAPATIAGILVERFVASVLGQQTHTAAATMATPTDRSIEVSAVQSPATASVGLENPSARPAPVLSTAGRKVPRAPFELRRNQRAYTPAPARPVEVQPTHQLEVAAQQSGHTLAAALTHTPAHAIAGAATQQGARLVGRILAAPFSDEEELLLLAVLLEAA